LLLDVFRVTANVSGLCDGGAIEAKKLILLLMFNLKNYRSNIAQQPT
jgi:predicted outer membrane repeat protein